MFISQLNLAPPVLFTFHLTLSLRPGMTMASVTTNKLTVLRLASFPTFPQLGSHFWMNLRMGSNVKEGTRRTLGAKLSTEAEWIVRVMQLDTAGYRQILCPPETRIPLDKSQMKRLSFVSSWEQAHPRKSSTQERGRVGFIKPKP